MIRFESNTIQLQAMRSSNVALLDITLDTTKVFEYYRCDDSDTAGVDFRALSLYLHPNNECVVARLFFNNGSFTILLETPRVQEYNLDMNEFTGLDAPPSFLSHKCVLKVVHEMVLGELMLNGMMGESTCRIRSKGGELSFTSLTEYGLVISTNVVSSTLEGFSLVLNDELPEVELSFCQHDLKKLFGAIRPASETVTLSLKDQMPLMLSHPIMCRAGQGGEMPNLLGI